MGCRSTWTGRRLPGHATGNNLPTHGLPFLFLPNSSPIGLFNNLVQYLGRPRSEAAYRKRTSRSLSPLSHRPVTLFRLPNRCVQPV